MIGIGFEPQTRKIVDEIPRSRQTLWCTLPLGQKRLQKYLVIYWEILSTSILETSMNLLPTTHHTVCRDGSTMDKQRRLQQIFRAEERGSKLIIFCSTEKICNQPSCGIVVVLVPQAFMVINHRAVVLLWLDVSNKGQLKLLTMLRSLVCQRWTDRRKPWSMSVLCRDLPMLSYFLFGEPGTWSWTRTTLGLSPSLAAWVSLSSCWWLPARAVATGCWPTLNLDYFRLATVWWWQVHCGATVAAVASSSTPWFRFAW